MIGEQYVWMGESPKILYKKLGSGVKNKKLGTDA